MMPRPMMHPRMIPGRKPGAQPRRHGRFRSQPTAGYGKPTRRDQLSCLEMDALRLASANPRSPSCRCDTSAKNSFSTDPPLRIHLSAPDLSPRRLLAPPPLRTRRLADTTKEIRRRPSPADVRFDTFNRICLGASPASEGPAFANGLFSCSVFLFAGQALPEQCTIVDHSASFKWPRRLGSAGWAGDRVFASMSITRNIEIECAKHRQRSDVAVAKHRQRYANRDPVRWKTLCVIGARPLRSSCRPGKKR